MRELRWTRPANTWLEGLPLGNGRIGAMALARADGVRLQLNDATAWSGSPGSEQQRVTPKAARAARERSRELFHAGRAQEAEAALTVLQGRYAQAFLPFAELEIRHRAAGDEVLRGLNLDEAVHTADLGEVQHRSFASAPDSALVHVLRADVPLDVEISVTTPLRLLGAEAGPGGAELSLALPADVAPAHEPDEPALRWHAEGVDPLQGALVLRWRHDGVTEEEPSGGRAGTMVRLSGVRYLEVVAATATTFTEIGRAPQGEAGEAVASARRSAEAGLARGAADLESRHRAAHRELFGRVSLRLSEEQVLEDPDLRASRPDAATDPALIEALFDYGRYLLISASRPGGLPATLQGLWNESMRPPWSSAYTLNINAEMNYWPVGPLHLAECADPLLRLTEALATRGTETAWRLYGARGWVAHHNSDAWAYTSPTGGDASWAQWPMGGVWLVCELMRLRRFGHAPAEWAQRLWPLVTGAAEFVLDLLTESGEDLVTFPSTSPENRYLTATGPVALTLGSAMDRALISELFDSVPQLAVEAGQESTVLLSEIAAARDRLRPPTLDADGTVREWHDAVEAEEPQHRHLSHLYFAYPGTADLRRRGGTDLAAAVRRTLDVRGDDSTGWSLAWKLAIRARLGDGERFGELLRYILRAADDTEQQAGGLYPNLFAAHPPFQIDGNLGLAAALSEALLQSHRGEIELLPALPPALSAGSVRGLVARPGVVIDLDWDGRRPRRVVMRALGAGGRYLLRHGEDRREIDVPQGEAVSLSWPGVAGAEAGPEYYGRGVGQPAPRTEPAQRGDEKNHE